MREVGREEGLPAVYFCTAGKDRTGVISMLIQSVCDVDEEIILSDYHLSHSLLTPIHNEITENFREYGITNPHFLLSPPSVLLFFFIFYLFNNNMNNINNNKR